MSTVRPLKILHVTSELTPLAGTGGLSDVASALPKALQARGHDVRIAMPCYARIPSPARGDAYCLIAADLGGKRQHGQLRTSTVPDTDLTLYLVEHEGYFGRPEIYGDGVHEYFDNAERFSFLCFGVIDGIRQTGWRPDVVHCHDWHGAPLPILLRTHFAADPFWHGIPVLFSIHNMAFQGRYSADRYASTGLPADLLNPAVLEYQGDFNLMKGAIHFADKIATVSPRYAMEIQTTEYGEGLDGALRRRSGDLCGILNGVDYAIWNPASDPHLPTNFDGDDCSGKAACKTFLQERLGLPCVDAPLFGMVSRLYWQKGIDLLATVIDDICALDVQIVVLGSGEPALAEALRNAASRHPDKIAVHIGFDDALAHQIQAASDFLLMPSRYEPCGLAQLYGMAYGALPVVRHTGGLADSVRDVNPVNLKHNSATGVAFVPKTPGAILRSVHRAVDLYKQPALYRGIQADAMHADFSWDRSCRAYETLYNELVSAA